MVSAVTSTSLGLSLHYVEGEFCALSSHLTRSEMIQGEIKIDVAESLTYKLTITYWKLSKFLASHFFYIHLEIDSSFLINLTEFICLQTGRVELKVVGKSESHNFIFAHLVI